MRLIVKQNKSNNINNVLKSIEYTHEFTNIEKKDYWFDYGKTCEIEDTNASGAFPSVIDFSFEVMELNEESILLEIGGIASGNFNKLKYRISKNNSIKFSQNIGEREYKYSITYAEDEEINGAKMPIHQFIRLFNSRVRLDNAEKSIYPPIFYSINQKYYNAAVKFLEKKIITHLKCGEFSISKIIYDYYPDLHFTSKKYIEALIVLYNIEYAGDRAYLVYHPNVIK